MIKGVVFDLDGTLLNTIVDLKNSVNSTYESFGYDTRKTDNETMAMVGHGMKNLIEQCFPLKDEEFIKEALKRFLKFYDEQYTRNTKPYKGIVELVDELNKKGIKIGVNSNKNDEYTQNLIRLNFKNISEKFVSGIKPGDKTKPDPTNVTKLVEKMGLNKNEVLYVGDSPTDAKTAQNAGIEFVSVTWGFRTKEKLIAAGATKIIDTPEDLIKYCN